jgi:tRNA (adenine22-N1)-methyltransferase
MEYYSRIEAIKGLVPNGARLLDVGTDHAILPIELVKEGVISFAIASDVNPSPLNRAKEEIAKNNLSSEIETILSNGFENIPYGSYNCVAICGMGGHLIWEIIEKAGDKSKYCPLILQPMSYPEALRKKLFQNGYKISNEVFAIDNNKSYVIMLVEYTGIPQDFTEADLYFGTFRPNNACYKSYENRIKKRFIKRLVGVLKKQL